MGDKMKNYVALVVVALVAATGSAGEWPRFLGQNADGFAPDKGINKDWAQKPPKLLWKVAMYDRAEKFRGYAGPSVSGGKVFFIDHQANQAVVRAIGLKDGAQAWEAKFDAGVEPCNCTPLVDSGNLYFVTARGTVFCATAAKGEVVWKVDLVSEYGSVPPQWKHAWSPVTDGAALLLTAGGPDATVVALDKATGKLMWKGGKTDGAGYAPVVPGTIAAKKRYILSAQTTIQAVGPDGALLWTFPWVNQWNVNAPAPIVSKDMVFVTSGYDKGCALLDGKTGSPVWQSKDIVSHFSTPVLHDGHLYCTSDPGRLVCMEFMTGKVKWQKAGFEKGGLCAVDGTIMVLDGKSGDLAQVALTPEGYKELGRMQAPLGGQSWTAPIVAEGKLIIRNKRELACLDLM
jgi:outer membrane protein assembly factor BamB